MIHLSGKIWIPLALFLMASQAPARPKNHKGGNRVKIASLSFVPEKWNKEKNLERIEAMSREAVKEGAELIITPEGALEGYLINVVRDAGKKREKLEHKFREIAETTEGPGVSRVRDLAGELNVDIVLGFLEREGPYLYNACIWIDHQGKILHTHRKTHMAQPYFDPPNYRPGHEIKAFDTDLGRVGMLICYERQVPEVCTALAVDGATLLINPSYGSRGEWNDMMLRTRARDNQCHFIFTHPQQTLVIGPDGEILLNKEDQEGVFFFELKGLGEKSGKLAKRRPEAFSERLSTHVQGGNQRLSDPGHIKVAAVQLAVSDHLQQNTQRICDHLEALSRKGVRVALFPECATTGYFSEKIPNHTEKDLKEAEKTIAQACSDNDLYAIVGTPYFVDGVRYNMALVINPGGNTIYKQAKIQLVGGDTGWAKAGNSLSVFRIDDITCSLIICHDSRYPELVRLPVLKGARLVFYLSCESDLAQEHKIEPYRAQVVARAVENGVYVIQANAPQVLKPWMGSHGQSRIVSPHGQLLQEAPIFGETVLIEELDMNEAGAGNALKSRRAPFLRDYWDLGIEKIGEVE